MSLSIEQYEKIVDFLENKMTPEEKSAFLNEVTTNAELQEELEWERVLSGKDNVFSVGDTKFEASQPPIDSANSKRKIISINRTRWMVAASILVVLLAGAAIILWKQRTSGPGIVKDKPVKRDDSTGQNKKDSSNNVVAPQPDYQLAFNQTYRKFKSPGNLPPDLENVDLAYQQQDYRRVIQEATGVFQARGPGKEDESVKSYAGFYKGIASMELNETQKAIEAFQTAGKASPSPALHDEILWYMALCYLKEKKKEECLKILDSLQIKGTKKKEALLLVKRLQGN